MAQTVSIRRNSRRAFEQVHGSFRKPHHSENEVLSLACPSGIPGKLAFLHESTGAWQAQREMLRGSVHSLQKLQAPFGSSQQRKQ
jgi:hypothetical protein